MQPDLSILLAPIRFSSSFAEFHDSSCLGIENSRDHSILLTHSPLLMAISVTLLSESLIAVFALERSDATMHADVVHHVAKLGERVSTCNAHQQLIRTAGVLVLGKQFDKACLNYVGPLIKVLGSLSCHLLFKLRGSTGSFAIHIHALPGDRGIFLAVDKGYDLTTIWGKNLWTHGYGVWTLRREALLVKWPFWHFRDFDSRLDCATLSSKSSTLLQIDLSLARDQVVMEDGSFVLTKCLKSWIKVFWDH